MYTTDVSTFWSVLGSFWQNFENKAYVQEMWQNYYNVMSGLYYKSNMLRTSVGFDRMDPVAIDYFESFDIVFEAVNTNYSGLVNTITASGTEGNRVEYYISPGTISIPTMTYYYHSSGGTVSSLETLTEGTDYYLVDMERIRFVNDPPFIHDMSQPHFKGNALNAEKVYKLNPALWGIESLKVGLSNVTYRDSIYNAFVSGYAFDGVERDLVDADHFKYLVWGLQTGIKKRPTISNIKNLYGLARGLPFAHNSGIFASGIIAGIDKTYPISGYYTPTFSGAQYIVADYPAFTNDYTIDIVGKFVSGSIGALLDIVSVMDGAYNQRLMVACSGTAIHMKAVGHYEQHFAGLGDQGLEPVITGLDVDSWHKYTIKHSGLRDVYFYIDDELVSNGTLSQDWYYAGESVGLYNTIYCKGNRPKAAEPGYDFEGYSGLVGSIAQIKIRDESGNTKFHVQLVPTESLTQTDFVDLTSSGYAVSMSGLLSYEQSIMPLMGYTTYNYEDNIPQFQVLLPGVQVYDYINAQEVVSGFIDFPEEQYSRLYFNDQDLQYKGTLSYDSEYLTDLMDNYIPAHIRYEINASGYDGIFLATWGSDNDGTGTRQNPYRTFAKAASMSSGYSNIWYRHGTYCEQLKTSLVSGVGSSWSSPFRVSAFPGETVNLVCNAGLSSGIIQFDKPGSNYISFDNFDINGQGRSQLLVNMAVSGAQYGQLYGCNLHNVISGSVTYMVNMEERGHKVKRCTINPGSWEDITAVRVTKNSVTGSVPVSGEVSYCEIQNCDKGIFITGTDFVTVYDFFGHHNYVHDNTIGIHAESCINTYIHNNLVENCGWGLAVGYGKKAITSYLVNNTIKSCSATGSYWKSSLISGMGIRLGSKQTITSGTPDFCFASVFLNNAISECDISYYDPSGIADGSNFSNTHKNNVCDDGKLPTTGFVSAATNLSGIVFYQNFLSASTTKDYKLHPYFSSGYAYGTNLSSYVALVSLEDINLDYSGVTRIGYSGWDAGAFENLA